MTEQPLWTTVDCACGKPPGLAHPRSTPLQEINLLYLGEVVDALGAAVDVLGARMDALQNQLYDVLDPLLSPAELNERIRRLREGL